MAAVAALVFALLAVTFAASPGQAQTPDNDYDDPQPCGPGAGTAFMEEPHEVTEGHFALFDAYWRTRPPPSTPTVADTASVGVLHTNECPPLMVRRLTEKPIPKWRNRNHPLRPRGWDGHR